MKIGPEQSVQMPMKTVISLIVMVALGKFGFFQIQEKLNQHSTKLELFEKDLQQNTEFRIKYPRGDLGQSSGESELFMLVELLLDLKKSEGAECDHDNQRDYGLHRHLYVLFRSEFHFLIFHIKAPPRTKAVHNIHISLAMNIKFITSIKSVHIISRRPPRIFYCVSCRKLFYN